MLKCRSYTEPRGRARKRERARYDAAPPRADRVAGHHAVTLRQHLRAAVLLRHHLMAPSLEDDSMAARSSFPSAGNARVLTLRRTCKYMSTHTVQHTTIQRLVYILVGALVTDCAAAHEWGLQLIVSGEFRASAFPTEASDDQHVCSAEAMRNDVCGSLPCACECIGGVARTMATLQQHVANDNDTLALDTGSYAFGNGAINYLMTTEERGNKTRRAFQDFFARSGYAGWTLTYRDFGYAMASRNGGGLPVLAAYIEGLRARDPELPAATVSNIDTNIVDELTEQHITEYTIMHTASGRRVALISVLDDEHLLARWGNLGTSRPYEDVIESALAKLRRLPIEEHPDAIVLVAKVPRETAELMVRATVGISAVLAFDSRDATDESWLMKNPAGDNVLMVPLCKSSSSEVGRVTIGFGGDGLVTNGSASCITMDCAVDDNPRYPALLDSALAFQEDSAEFMGHTIATLDPKPAEGWRCGITHGTPTSRCAARECEAPIDIYRNIGNANAN
eukprot:COSAG02_NODE_6259_length_3697_cov_2.145914_1_plen_507_part_10